MKPLSQNNFGSRLRLARKMVGFSLQELANALDNKVTKQALNKYEMGEMNPSSHVLMLISSCLNVKPDYFFNKNTTELGEILFRKKASLSKKLESSIIEKVRYFVERYLEIENIVGLESKFINPIQDLTILTEEDVKRAASSLRNAWNLGSSPLSNIVEMLELNGIKVLLIDDTESVDGLSVFTTKGIPVVVVNCRDKSIERTRFTIVHELAHLLLRIGDDIVNNTKAVEKICHLFASSFLLPDEMLVKMIGTGKRNYIYLQELVTIKEYFGISIRAINHKLRDLEIITDSYYRRWVIYLSKTFGFQREPGNYKGEEKSIQFNRLVNRALAEDLISVSKAASLLNVDVNELRKGFNGAK